MPVQVTYPGVYVQEAPSGVHTIAQVATSVAAFVGMCPSGPVNIPTAVFSFREFDRIFGGDVDVGELPDQVRQFFLNGGSEAWIVRNALGALDGAAMVAKSTLRAELVGTTNPGAKVLVVSAKNAGSAGNNIQLAVDYVTSSPERTFNLTVLLPVTKSNGVTVFEPAEPTYTELSMDPSSPRFAPVIVSGQSALIDLEIDASIGGPTTVNPVDATANVSQSGLIFNSAAGSLATFVTNKILAGGTDRLMFVSVANGPPVRVNLQGISAANDGAVTGAIKTLINSALQDAGQTATVTNVALTAAAGGGVLTIQSNDGPVVITSAPANDVAAILAFGVANGGLETDAYSIRRPAPTGMLTRVHTGSAPGTLFARINGFAATAKNSVGNWKIDAPPHGGTAAVAEYAGATLMGDDTSIDPSVAGTFSAVAKMLDALVNSINNTAAVSTDFTAYRAGMRVGIRPTYGSADSDLTLTLSSPGATGAPYTLDGGGNIAQTGTRPTNVVRYRLGLALPPAPAAPGGAYRDDVQLGNDGGNPLPDDYSYSWDKLERVADIFNIMVLPRSKGLSGLQTDAARAAIWPLASQFCERLRAFLIVDPPATWITAAAAVADIVNLRGPLVQDYAAVYWPRVITNDPAGNKITIDPAGTIAGLYANTDTKRGVWKAPAGLEATLIGVNGLEHYVTNDENGQTNPQAINTLRMKVSGITSWGARTLIGFEGTADEDYRYVPVRRLALLIEESLYRGLQFAVFEPNAEPLWGQIRLAAGSFMNGLFQQGAFKGLKASDAYYVACGADTTDQRAINSGVVYVEVGFAPLKPAEFVVITIKQLAGQIQT